MANWSPKKLSTLQTWNRYVSVHLQIKYLLIAGLNLDKILDEIGDFGRTNNDILYNIFRVSLLMLVMGT